MFAIVIARRLLLIVPRVGCLLGGSNRGRRRRGSMSRVHKLGALVQGSGGPGRWILRLDRHRRPARKRRGLDSLEEIGVTGGMGLGTLEPTGPGTATMTSRAMSAMLATTFLGRTSARTVARIGRFAEFRCGSRRNSVLSRSWPHGRPHRTRSGTRSISAEPSHRSRRGPYDPTIRLSDGARLARDADRRRTGHASSSSTRGPAAGRGVGPGRGPGAGGRSRPCSGSTTTPRRSRAAIR